MKLDAARSRIAIFTYAEGLFSRLAHDLELTATGVSGALDSNACTLHIPARSIQVVGAVKRGKVDTGVLSQSDRETIERQVHNEVFRDPNSDLVVRGTRGTGEGAHVRIAITVPSGRTELSCPIGVTESASETRARGDVDLSLRALAIPPIKGPLGAFRISDRVRVAFDLVFTAAQ